jgi:hypothetical protein
MQLSGPTQQRRATTSHGDCIPECLENEREFPSTIGHLIGRSSVRVAENESAICGYSFLNLAWTATRQQPPTDSQRNFFVDARLPDGVGYRVLNDAIRVRGQGRVGDGDRPLALKLTNEIMSF